MDRVEVWDCEENLSKALVGVHLLRWIVTYPVDKVIRSSSNWGLPVKSIHIIDLSDVHAAIF